MGSSGYIDWHRLDRTMGWVKHRAGQHTYVYAFWLVDFGRNDRDRGVSLLKDGTHPDWFIHAETADHLLGAYANPTVSVSPNFTRVFDNHLSSRPLLASLLLGTADSIYKTTSEQDRLWWAAKDDLTRPGKRLLKDMNKLYERDAHLITFIDTPTDERVGPRDSR